MPGADEPPVVDPVRDPASRDRLGRGRRRSPRRPPRPPPRPRAARAAPAARLGVGHRRPPMSSAAIRIVSDGQRVAPAGLERLAEQVDVRPPRRLERAVHRPGRRRARRGRGRSRPRRSRRSAARSRAARRGSRPAASCPGGIGDATGRITTDTSPVWSAEPALEAAVERRLLAGPQAAAPRTTSRVPSRRPAPAATAPACPSREASHATWYSGLTMLVVPGAPVSSWVA